MTVTEDELTSQKRGPVITDDRVARPARAPGDRPRCGRQGLRGPTPSREGRLRPGDAVPRRRRPPCPRVPRDRWGRDGDGRPALAARPPGRGAAPPRRRRRPRDARHHRGAPAPRRARGQGRDRLDEPGRSRRRHLDDGRPLHRVRRGQHLGVRSRGRQDAAPHRRHRRRHGQHHRGLRQRRHRARRARTGRDGRAAALRARRRTGRSSCARTRLPSPARSRSPPAWARPVPTRG